MRAVALRMRRYQAPPFVGALILVLACAAAGILLARSLGGLGTPETGAADSGRREAAGSLQLQLPADWSPVARPPTLPGFATAKRIAARHGEPRTDLVAALLPADHKSLLPAALVERLVTPRPSATVISVGEGMLAYLYVGLRVRGVPEVLDVLAWPTTKGVATVACLAPASMPYLAGCDEVARTASVAGERGLPLGRAAALLSRLPAVLASVDAARRRHGTGVAHGSAGAAGRLATAHRRAGDALSHIAAASGHPLIEQGLRDEGRAYARLASALRRRDRPAAVRARTRIEAGERQLQRELDVIAGGYQR